MKLKKGDVVMVRSGRSKGKKGKVLRVLRKNLTVVVEGVNIVKKHQRPSQKFQGGIIEKPAALPVGRVMLVCPRCGKPARLTRARICRACGVPVDKEGK